MTSAQGQLMTRKVSDLYSQSEKTAPGRKMGGRIARRIARITTEGVYQRAKEVMKFSERDFLLLAFSTSSKILLAVESSNTLVALTRMRPVKLIEPLKTSSPSMASLSLVSPVRAEVSIEVAPDSITPSSGMRSPLLTMKTSPI